MEGAHGQSGSQADYLQQLLDQAHGELAEYKRGMVREIREPLLMELVTLAQSIETFLHGAQNGQSAEDVRNFLEKAVLGDVRQALSRYGVEPFICSTRTINRKLQKVVQVEETDDQSRAGQVVPFTRGYATGDRVLQKEQVLLYRVRGAG